MYLYLFFSKQIVVIILGGVVSNFDNFFQSGEGAHLSWEAPQFTSGEITEYSVYLAVKSATTGSQTTVTSNPNQLAFVRVYCGRQASCAVGNVHLATAHIDTTTKPAIIFRIAARNEKGYGPATQVRWLQDTATGQPGTTGQGTTPTKGPAKRSPLTNADQ